MLISLKIKIKTYYIMHEMLIIKKIKIKKKFVLAFVLKK